MPQALPGFDSPAVGFEQPYAMLAACHERVQRTLNLLERLLDHVAKQGHDAHSRSAAADVLRYFDRAAPLHHEDEEKHVFPRLLALGDEPLRDLVRRLQAEHAEMARLWACIRRPLLRWSAGGARDRPSAALRLLAARWQALYRRHIALEESRAFVAAAATMDAAALAGMGAEMQARRRG